MLPGYMDGISRAGGLPVMLPLSSDESVVSQICRSVDGLLFTGGQDVSPGLYGEDVSALCGLVCKERDDMETMLLNEAIINMNKPAFGICRGIQLINAARGGTLYQDLPSQYEGKFPVGHWHALSDAEPSHSVILDKGSPLHTLVKSDSIEVNSSHHQGIRELSPELECMAVAKDGLIEAVYMPNRRFVWAVQWHPELSLHDENSHMLFKTFVSACDSAQHTEADADSKTPDTELHKALQRLASFENVYDEIAESMVAIPLELKKLKAAGKEKTVRYREMLGQKLMDNQIKALFERHGISFADSEESP